MATPYRFRSIHGAECLGLLVLSGLLAGCVDIRKVKVEETQVIELMATDVKKVAAFADNGSIVVRPSSGSDTIRVEAKIIARGRDQEDAEEALAAVEIQTPRSGVGDSTQEIRWGWNTKRPGHWSADVSFEIEMPAALALAATTDNGEIDVQGIQGIRELESDNGSVQSSDWTSKEEAVWDGTLSATESKVVATTDNGQIDVESAAATVTLATDNGGIKLRSAGKNVNLATNNGGINARLTTSGRIDGQIRTDNGAVQLTLNPNSSVRLDCRSDHGQVSTINLPMNERSNFNSPGNHRLKCAVGSGDGLLEIETDNGAITIEGMPESPKVFH